MQLQYLKYLIDIEQTNSLSKTAEANYVSRQALTKSLQSLEKELGTALYFVNGKKVYLTPAGKIVTDFAKTTLINEQVMLDQLAQLNAGTHDALSFKILSFSAITNLCTKHILDYFDIGFTPVDIEVNVISSYTMSNAIELIKTCSENVIFLTISSDLLSVVLEQLSGSILSYAVLFEDIAAVCTSKDLDVTAENTHLLENENKFKNAIFSVLPSRQITFSKSYRNISSDAELMKSLLMNKNTIVYLPYKLSQMIFTFKPNRYIPLENYGLSHIILFKTEFPFQDDLVAYLRNKLI